MTAPYSRVYWSIMDDEKFDGIREDARLLGSWTLLLVVADMAHPAPAFLPPTVSRTSVARLVEAGLVDLLAGHRYRVHGLDAERGRRSESARVGGLASGRSRTVEQPLNGRSQHPRTESNLDETRRDKDETRRDNARDDSREDLEAFLLITRRAPTPRQRALLDGLLDRHDQTGPKWAADIMLRHPDDPIGALIAADKAYRDERIAEAQAAEAPKPKPRRLRGLPESTKEILAHWAAAEVKDMT